MIIEILFVFTAAMLVVALFKMIPAMWGTDITLPYIIPYTQLAPTHYLIMYPSTIFQVWFWATQLGLFIS